MPSVSFAEDRWRPICPLCRTSADSHLLMVAWLRPNRRAMARTERPLWASRWYHATSCGAWLGDSGAHTGHTRLLPLAAATSCGCARAPLSIGGAHTHRARARGGKSSDVYEVLTCTAQPARHGDVTPPIPPADLPQWPAVAPETRIRPHLRWRDSPIRRLSQEPWRGTARDASVLPCFTAKYQGECFREFALVHGQGEVGLAVQRHEAGHYT